MVGDALGNVAGQKSVVNEVSEVSEARIDTVSAKKPLPVVRPSLPNSKNSGSFPNSRTLAAKLALERHCSSGLCFLKTDFLLGPH